MWNLKLLRIVSLALITFWIFSGFMFHHTSNKPMTKIVFLVKKHPDLSRAEYQRYSTEIHSPIVMRLPGLQKYTVNYVLPANPEEKVPYDGMVELWFESSEALQKAFASEVFQEASADLPNFLDTTQQMVSFVVEEQVLQE